MYSLIEKKKLYKSYLLFWSFILRLKPKKFQISVSASIKKSLFDPYTLFKKHFAWALISSSIKILFLKGSTRDGSIFFSDQKYPRRYTYP